MTMNSTTRKNRVDLASHAPAAVGVEVHASNAAVGERMQAEGLIRALNGWTEHLAEQGIETKQKERAGNEAKGWQDAALGEEDEALKQDDAYKRGRQKQRTTAEGLAWFNDATKERAELQRNDPDFDFTKWKQSKLDEFLSRSGDDHEAMALANGMATRFMENVEAGYANDRAKLALADAENDVSRTFAEAFRGRMVPDGGAFKRLVADAAANTALDEGEAKAIGFSHLLTNMQVRGDRGASEYEAFLAQAEGMADEFAADPQQSEAFAKSLEAGRREVATLREQERRDKANVDLATWERVHRAIDQGTFSSSDAADLVKRGYADAPQAAGWIAQASAARERRFEKAHKAATEAQEALAFRQRLERGEGFLVDPKAAQKAVDDMYGGSFVAFNDAMREGDPAAQAQAAAGVASAVAIARRNQIIPRGLKHQFEKLDLSNPAMTKQIGEGFAALDKAGLGKFIKGQIGDAAYVRLSLYRDLRKDGFDPESAAQQLTTLAQREPAEAQRELRFRSNSIRTAALDLADGATNAGLAEAEITKLATLYVMHGADVDSAVQRAASAASERLTRIGGVLVQSGTLVSEDAEALVESYLGDHLRPMLEEKLPGAYEDRELMLAPVRDKPGNFYVLDDRFQPVVVDGKMLFLTETEMAARSAEARHRAHAAQEATNAELQRHLATKVNPQGRMN